MIKPNVIPIDINHHPHPVQEFQTQYNYPTPIKGFAPRLFIVPQWRHYRMFHTERDNIPQ